MLSAQPQTGRNAQTLAVAALRDTAALERGIKMRTLYQHSARRSSITHKYVAAVTARGAEVRTLDEFFNRMIVIDRRVAIIPGQDSLRMAVAIRDPHVVAYLVDVFQRSWERARPFTNKETSLMRDIAVEQRAMTIRMLIEGHSDPTSAKRLGVSPRTYAGYVADLKAEYEAETRFQLGYVMGSRGISGQEAADRAAEPTCPTRTETSGSTPATTEAGAPRCGAPASGVRRAGGRLCRRRRRGTRRGRVSRSGRDVREGRRGGGGAARVRPGATWCRWASVRMPQLVSAWAGAAIETTPRLTVSAATTVAILRVRLLMRFSPGGWAHGMARCVQCVAGFCTRGTGGCLTNVQCENMQPARPWSCRS